MPIYLTEPLDSKVKFISIQQKKQLQYLALKWEKKKNRVTIMEKPIMGKTPILLNSILISGWELLSMTCVIMAHEVA